MPSPFRLSARDHSIRIERPNRIADDPLRAYCSFDDIHSAPRGELTMLPRDPTILDTLVLLVQTFGTLVVQLAALGFHWVLWIVWAAWCLWAVNWKKTRHFLAAGAWAPAILLVILVALVWSRIDADAWLGLPNFWWQLGYVSLLAGLAMFCGWVQSVMHWTPHDINLEPPAHGHGHDHGHAHH
jgi:hypothetical protein